MEHDDQNVDLTEDEAAHKELQYIDSASSIPEAFFRFSVAVMAPDEKESFVTSVTELAPVHVVEVQTELRAKGFPKSSIYCIRRPHSCNVNHNGVRYVHRGVLVLAFDHHRLWPSKDEVSTVWDVFRSALHRQYEDSLGCMYVNVGVKLLDADVDKFADNASIPLLSAASQSSPYALATAQGVENVFVYCQDNPLEDGQDPKDPKELSAADRLAANCLVGSNPQEVLNGYLRLKMMPSEGFANKLMQLWLAPAAATPAHGGDADTSDFAAHESHTAFE